MGCTTLTTITIPESVNLIEFKAFSDCTSLAEILYKGQSYTSKQAFHDNFEGNVHNTAFANTGLNP